MVQVFTLGKVSEATKGPGLVFIWRPFQRAVIVSLRTTVLEVPSQDIITRDNVSLKVSSVVYFRVLNAQQAILGVFVFASPAIILSGFAAPVENMPPGVEWISRIDPIRYMLIIARGIFLQAMPADVALAAIWPMALAAVVLMGLAVVAVRRAVS